VLKTFIPSYKIKVMPGGQSSISKCQKSKITWFGHNFVINIWICIWILQKINPDKRLCRACKTKFFFQGQGHSNRSTTKYSPNSAFSDHNCAMQVFFQIVLEKYLDYWIYTLKLSYTNYSSRIQPTDKPWMSLQQSHGITATHQNFRCYFNIQQ